MKPSILTRRGFTELTLSLLALSFTGCIEKYNSYRETTRQPFFLDDTPLTIGHRGAAIPRPENTHEAFLYAVDIGVDMIEYDLRLSKDNEVVVLHDETVNRTTDGEGPVNEMTLNEIKELDAGYSYTPDDGETYPYRGTGVEIPTLEEVLSRYQDTSHMLHIKRNGPTAEMLVEIVEDKGIDDRVVFGSFDVDVLQDIREIRPVIPTILGVNEMVEFIYMSKMDEFTYNPPSSIIGPPLSVAGPGIIDRADRVGMQSFIWTVNDREDMKRVLDIGVDGVITDDPKILRDVMEDMGAK